MNLSKIKSILFWSVISAAFVGPGTITTAAKAGATFKSSLIWALVFSLVATVFFQEGAARITLASKKSLGDIIGDRFKSGKRTLGVVLFSLVAFGCMAYEAGNMLGAIAGIKLIYPVSTKATVGLITISAATVLWFGGIKITARLLGAIVAIMGIAFVIISLTGGSGSAYMGNYDLSPLIPVDSLTLILGLIGTTIVPYNLFLASGISKGQSMSDMRFGLIGAVAIGGIVALAILMAARTFETQFGFENLYSHLSNQQGAWASSLFALGLFAAGFTSAITAPLAAAVTAKTLLGWKENGFKFRLVWISVLLVGCIFGLIGSSPVEIIISAQAINGFLLPFILMALLFILNDRKTLGIHVNRHWQNGFMILFTIVIVCLSLYKLGQLIS